MPVAPYRYGPLMPYQPAVELPMKLNPTLQEIFDTGHVRDAEGNEYEAFPTAINRDEGTAIYETIVKNRATRTLEIGLGFGVSTLFICQALEDLGGGRHIGLDPFQIEGYHDVGLANVERAGYGAMFTFHKHFSQDLLPQFLINGDKFDFILIDGHHTFEQIMLDFYYSEKIIEVGGLIMFHDVVYPSVRKALTFILRNLNFELAMEDYLVEPSFLGRIYTFGRMAMANPLEPLTWRPMYKVNFQRNFCIVRRTDKDTRDWMHYVPF